MPELLRRTGWIKMYRSDATLAKALRDFERAKQYGVAGDVLDGKAIVAREPHLTGEFAAARSISPHPASCRIRADWPKPMRRCSSRKGGRFLVGDARTLEQKSGGDGGSRRSEGTVSRP